MKSLRPYSEYGFFLLRVIAALLFACHGSQKLFAFPGGRAMEVGSQMWFAGIIEFFGGLMIALGIFPTIAAFIACGEMAAAYFQAHFPRGVWPILNGGELAVLYCFLWLYLVLRGPGRFTLTRY
jgi:putative oxidoreductase